MSFFLSKKPDDPLTDAGPIPTTEDPGVFETNAAQFEATAIQRDLRNRAFNTEKDIVAEIKDALPPEFVSQDGFENTPVVGLFTSMFNDGPAPFEQRNDSLFEAVRRARVLNPGKFIDLPTSNDEFDAKLLQRRQSELDEARSVLDISDRWFAKLAGDMASNLATEQGLTLAIAGGVEGGILRTALTEGALSGVDEALTLPQQFDVAAELDTPAPQPLRQVSEAFAAGAVFAGAIKGVASGSSRFLAYRKARAATTGERRPDGVGQQEFDQQVREGEQALDNPRAQDDQPEVESADTTEAGTLGTILDVSALELNPIVRQTLDFIGDLEAPKGYNQVFSGIAQNDLPPKTLTEMTVDEVLAWQDRIDPKYNSEAAGRFQIMEDTLRHLKRSMGLRGDEVFSETMQDRLAIALMREQGLDAFLAGTMSPRVFGQKIAGVWAGLPQLTGAGRGSSVFEGFNGNKSLTGANSFERVLTRPGSYKSVGDLFQDAQSFRGFTTRRGFTSTGQVTAGGDLRIDVEYQVVDASTLTRASGDLQPRDRSRVSSDEQINEIAAGLDPARLMPSPEADRGAPVVGPDNVIESGNGRVAAIQRAFERHPDRADAYRQQIEQAGFEIPQGVTEPVLIARRTSSLDAPARQEFVRMANTSAIARMSPTERATADAAAINSDTVALFKTGQPIGSAANAKFARKALDSLPQAERSGLVDAKGRINAEGEQRLRQALFARAYDAPDILARFTETGAGDLRGFLDALEEAAPEWAALRAAVDDGRVLPEMDITDFVLDAMRLIADARAISAREGTAAAKIVQELLDDVDLLDGAVSPLTSALVNKFLPGGRAAPADKIADFMKRYASEAQKVGRTGASLLDDTPGPLDVLKAIDRETFGQLNETGTTHAGRMAQSELPEIDIEAMPDNAFADGANSPELDAAADQALAALRADAEDLANFDDLSIDLQDGTTASAREFLDDLDADEALETVLSLCGAKGGG